MKKTLIFMIVFFILSSARAVNECYFYNGQSWLLESDEIFDIQSPYWHITYQCANPETTCGCVYETISAGRRVYNCDNAVTCGVGEFCLEGVCYPCRGFCRTGVGDQKACYSGTGNQLSSLRNDCFNSECRECDCTASNDGSVNVVINTFQETKPPSYRTINGKCFYKEIYECTAQGWALTSFDDCEEAEYEGKNYDIAGANAECAGNDLIIAYCTENGCEAGPLDPDESKRACEECADAVWLGSTDFNIDGAIGCCGDDVTGDTWSMNNKCCINRVVYNNNTAQGNLLCINNELVQCNDENSCQLLGDYYCKSFVWNDIKKQGESIDPACINAGGGCASGFFWPAIDISVSDVSQRKCVPQDFGPKDCTLVNLDLNGRDLVIELTSSALVPRLISEYLIEITNSAGRTKYLIRNASDIPLTQGNCRVPALLEAVPFDSREVTPDSAESNEIRIPFNQLGITERGFYTFRLGVGDKVLEDGSCCENLLNPNGCDDLCTGLSQTIGEGNILDDNSTEIRLGICIPPGTAIPKTANDCCVPNDNILINNPIYSRSSFPPYEADDYSYAQGIIDQPTENADEVGIDDAWCIGCIDELDVGDNNCEIHCGASPECDEQAPGACNAYGYCGTDCVASVADSPEEMNENGIGCYCSVCGTQDSSGCADTRVWNPEMHQGNRPGYCCGDKEDEFLIDEYCDTSLFEREGITNCPESTGCCDSATDCVHEVEGVIQCFESGGIETNNPNVDDDSEGDPEFCYFNTWYDCDSEHGCREGFGCNQLDHTCQECISNRRDYVCPNGCSGIIGTENHDLDCCYPLMSFPLKFLFAQRNKVIVS